MAAVFCCEPKPRKVLWIHRHLALKPATSVATYTASQLFMVSARLSGLSNHFLPFECNTTVFIQNLNAFAVFDAFASLKPLAEKLSFATRDDASSWI